MPAALDGSPEGVAFLAELRAYLAEYGQRSERPSRSQRTELDRGPTPVIDDPAGIPRAAGPRCRGRAGSAGRRARARHRRGARHGWPAIRGRSARSGSRLLRAAQQATVLSEDHAYWIDLCGLYQARRVVVEVGRRLAEAGAITVAADVVYLTLDEVREALEGRPARNAPALVAARKAEMEYFRTITPPPAIGNAPPDPRTTTRSAARWRSSWACRLQRRRRLESCWASAGSPGTVRGIARVVLSLADAGKLQPGDILVTEYTGPWWTPLFGVAGGLVTDFGGVLSHCAIVAREFGIPAVVGTGTATTTLLDGQFIEVDGDQGDRPDHHESIVACHRRPTHRRARRADDRRARHDAGAAQLDHDRRRPAVYPA